MERKLPSMGMSASQARLLSITSRLTNNEFRSQTITNSKLRLATESQEASRNYMDALNSKQLMFMNYDDNGSASKVELTPAVLYDYAPLKNQYMLTNSAGKVLVNNTEAQNYENADTLEDFLANYVNVKSIETLSSKEARAKYENDYAKYLKDLDNYNNVTYPAYLIDKDNYDNRKAQYEADMLIYLDKKNQYDEVDYPAYLEELKKYNEVDYPAYEYALQYYNDNVLPPYQALLEQYNKDKADYDIDYAQYLIDLQNLPNDDMYKMFTSVVGDIYNPESCYQNALNGHTGCYAHVLTFLLGYDYVDGTNNDKASTEDLYTSTNVKFNLEDNDITGAALHPYPGNELIPVGNRMKDPSLLCDGDDDYHAPYRQNGIIYRDEVKENIIQNAIDAGRKPTEIEILKSDYIYDEATNSVAGIKTLKQKAIDLLYVIKNYNQFADYESIVNFTDGDFKSIASVVPPVPPILPEMPVAPIPPTPPTPPTEPIPPVFNETMPTPPTKPEPPEEPVPEYLLSVDDQPKAQWYVNMWYKMNNSNTANVVKSKDEYMGESSSTIFYVEAAEKNKHGGNYEVYDQNLFASAEWLRFALEQGIITMEQAQYFNPAEDSLKAMELTSTGYKWNNIVYTSARDFVQQDNQKAIAMAEVKYKKRITEIENQDTKFDQDLKKLDTEHNALMTEYESIKEVLSKNVERSFKAFS